MHSRARFKFIFVAILIAVITGPAAVAQDADPGKTFGVGLDEATVNKLKALRKAREDSEVQADHDSAVDVELDIRSMQEGARAIQKSLNKTKLPVVTGCEGHSELDVLIRGLAEENTRAAKRAEGTFNTLFGNDGTVRGDLAQARMKESQAETRESNDALLLSLVSNIELEKTSVTTFEKSVRTWLNSVASDAPQYAIMKRLGEPSTTRSFAHLLEYNEEVRFSNILIAKLREKCARVTQEREIEATRLAKEKAERESAEKAAREAYECETNAINAAAKKAASMELVDLAKEVERIDTIIKSRNYGYSKRPEREEDIDPTKLIEVYKTQLVQSEYMERMEKQAHDDFVRSVAEKKTAELEKEAENPVRKTEWDPSDTEMQKVIRTELDRRADLAKKKLKEEFEEKVSALRTQVNSDQAYSELVRLKYELLKMNPSEGKELIPTREDRLKLVNAALAAKRVKISKN